MLRKNIHTAYLSYTQVYPLIVEKYYANSKMVRISLCIADGHRLRGGEGLSGTKAIRGHGRAGERQDAVLVGVWF